MVQITAYHVCVAYPLGLRGYVTDGSCTVLPRTLVMPLEVMLRETLFAASFIPSGSVKIYTGVRTLATMQVRTLR